MKKKKLIEELQKYPEDCEVSIFVDPYYKFMFELEFKKGNEVTRDRIHLKPL